jgi:hypothetical protein
MRVSLGVLLALGRSAAAEIPPTPETQGDLRHGKGLDFRSSDDSTRLNLRARLQLRFSQFSSEPGEPPEVSEFQARRIRVLFQGHVQTDWHYYLQLSFANLDNEPDLRIPLRDAYVTYARLRDLNIRSGQMKVPFGRQRVVSSSALQMVDRSITSGELNIDRDVGVQLLSDDLFGSGGKLAYNLGVFSGDGRNRVATAPGVLFVARASVRPFGAFDDFVEGDLQRACKPRLALAVAVAHNNNTNRERSTLGGTYELGRFDYRHAVADVMFKYAGFSLISEIMYRKASERFVEAINDMGELQREYARDAWGFYAQAGYFVTDSLELTGRYSDLRPRNGTDPDLVRVQELGGGTSWYIEKHDLKLQADYFYLFGDAAGRHQARLQLQLFL